MTSRKLCSHTASLQRWVCRSIHLPSTLLAPPSSTPFPVTVPSLSPLLLSSPSLSLSPLRSPLFSFPLILDNRRRIPAGCSTHFSGEDHSEDTISPSVVARYNLLCFTVVCQSPRDEEDQLQTLLCLRGEIRVSTSSMTSVPKPLKFLKDHFTSLQEAYENMVRWFTATKIMTSVSISILPIPSCTHACILSPSHTSLLNSRSHVQFYRTSSR